MTNSRTELLTLSTEQTTAALHSLERFTSLRRLFRKVYIVIELPHTENVVSDIAVAELTKQVKTACATALVAMSSLSRRYDIAVRIFPPPKSFVRIVVSYASPTNPFSVEANTRLH